MTAPETRRTGELPNLIVIGAQKSGTSALHYYLDLHPEVQMSSPKELCFFLCEDDFEPGPFISEPRELELLAGMRNWSRGRDWYERHFRSGARVRGEATPGYASPWFPGVAERMAGLVPDAKLIFIARDPLERIVSHYMQMLEMGREWRPLSEAVGRPDSIYVARSRYASLLRPFRERYPAERLLIVRHDDLLDRRREAMRRVFGFLGVSEGFWSPRMERQRHPSARKGRRFRALSRIQQASWAKPFYRLPQEAKWVLERLAYSSGQGRRPVLGPELRLRLLEELEPEILELERITGWNLAAWREAAAPPPRARSRRRSRTGR